MKKLPVYLLFSLYPVLSLWSQNIQEVTFSQIVRVLAVSVILCVFVFAVMLLIFRNYERSGLIAMMAILIFFSYGHLYQGVREYSFELARHRYFLPAIVVLFSAWVFYVTRARQVKGLVDFFNIFSIVILLMPLFTIINFEVKSYTTQRTQDAITIVQQSDQEKSRPDIFYIIVDGYGRQDVLKNYYGFDNSEFISYLENKGFYVAKESTSNYRKTVLSLTSSLNMTYVQDLFPELDPNSRDYTELIEAIHHSGVRTLLAENGYQLVTANNGLQMTMTDADVLLTPDAEYLSERVNLDDDGYSIDLNSFEGLFVETTLAKLWVDWQVSQGRSNILNVVAVEAPYNRQRKYILYGIESLSTAADMDGDNFVFVHIVAPHPPFVFGPNGEQIKHDRLFTIADGPYSQGSKEDYVNGYTGQVAFLNKQLMNTIDYILDHSQTKPIIIIQGDHGPKGFSDKNVENNDFTENFGILNAYYFPDGNYSDLYQSISPVNSFRILFNNYFGGSFSLQPDESYYSDEKHPFKFVPVSGQIQ
jgi:hypothetical protein